MILTIGHSNRAMDELLALLKRHGVEKVVDVRAIPGSARNPQFNAESLETSLRSAGIAYRHISGLGGRRRARKDSPNAGWRNDSFRGFADHMLSPEFEESLAALMEEAAAAVTAIMCAEAVPWRCHRSLIADALTVRGVAVEHIVGAGKRRPHTVTPFARVEGTRIIYAADS